MEHKPVYIAKELDAKNGAIIGACIGLTSSIIAIYTHEEIRELPLETIVSATAIGTLQITLAGAFTGYINQKVFCPMFDYTQEKIYQLKERFFKGGRK